MSASIEQNIAKLRQRICAAALKYQRQPEAITLLAVSKTRGAEAVRTAYQAGVRHIGENYLQEALDKIACLSDLPLIWHFIGPIQSNKTRAIAEHFHWVHSVDRLKVAQRLNDQRPAALPPLSVCLQVNINSEATKTGLVLEQLPQLAEQIAQLPRLQLRGLMAIPEASQDFQRQRANFAQLRLTLEQLRQQCPGLDTLSMGMSNDMEAAIAEGATLVRIGTDIFGARSNS